MKLSGKKYKKYKRHETMSNETKVRREDTNFF